MLLLVRWGFPSTPLFPKKYQSRAVLNVSVHVRIIAKYLLLLMCFSTTDMVLCYSILFLLSLNTRFQRFIYFAACTSIKLNPMKLLTFNHF